MIGSLRSVAALGVAVGVFAGATAQTWDIASDFSLGAQTGAWRYGYTTTLGGTFNQHTATTTVSGIDVWYTAGLSGDLTPSVFRNLSGGNVNGVNAGELGLHSGPNGQFGVARFIAPTSGYLGIGGAFGAGDIGAVDVHILQNGVSIFSHLGTTTAQSFSFTDLVVSSGDTIDFVVGFAGDYRFDSTPLAASLRLSAEPVPEPTTMALGLGAAAMAIRKRRAARG